MTNIVFTKAPKSSKEGSMKPVILCLAELTWQKLVKHLEKTKGPVQVGLRVVGKGSSNFTIFPTAQVGEPNKVANVRFEIECVIWATQKKRVKISQNQSYTRISLVDLDTKIQPGISKIWFGEEIEKGFVHILFPKQFLVVSKLFSVLIIISLIRKSGLRWRLT